MSTIFQVFDVTNVSFSGPALFAPEEIILLSDSLCASACSTFAEAMREIGVRSVAYGGSADSKGKLQVSGGTRGYDWTCDTIPLKFDRRLISA